MRCDLYNQCDKSSLCIDTGLYYYVLQLNVPVQNRKPVAPFHLPGDIHLKFFLQKPKTEVRIGDFLPVELDPRQFSFFGKRPAVVIFVRDTCHTSGKVANFKHGGEPLTTLKADGGN